MKCEKIIKTPNAFPHHFRELKHKLIIKIKGIFYKLARPIESVDDLDPKVTGTGIHRSFIF